MHMWRDELRKDSRISRTRRVAVLSDDGHNPLELWLSRDEDEHAHQIVERSAGFCERPGDIPEAVFTWRLDVFRESLGIGIEPGCTRDKYLTIDYHSSCIARPFFVRRARINPFADHDSPFSDLEFSCKIPLAPTTPAPEI